MKKLATLLIIFSCCLFPAIETSAAEISLEEQIAEEQFFGEMELLAQLIQAEAGNQDLTGMMLVGTVVLNRVDSSSFPNTIEEVIFEDRQFSCIFDGNFEDAGWNISDDAYLAAQLCMEGDRLDSGILYFSSTTDPANGKNAWKYGDHWFSY